MQQERLTLHDVRDHRCLDVFNQLFQFPAHSVKTCFKMELTGANKYQMEALDKLEAFVDEQVQRRLGQICR